MTKYEEFEIRSAVDAIESCLEARAKVRKRGPDHPGDVPKGTLRAIIRQMGISVQDFNAL